MRVMSGLLVAFAGGVIGFFLFLGTLAVGLLCWAAGCVSFLYLLAAVWLSARWWITGDPASGQSALGCWALAAAAFAVTPVLIRGAGMLREGIAGRVGRAPRRREEAALERIGRLRLAAH